MTVQDTAPGSAEWLRQRQAAGRRPDIALIEALQGEFTLRDAAHIADVVLAVPEIKAALAAQSNPKES